MAVAEPIQLQSFARDRKATGWGGPTDHAPDQAEVVASAYGGTAGFAVVAFTRAELSAILAVYGRLMAEGECRDYALDFGREQAVFSIFRRTSDVPLYRIEKTPKLARKQGAFAVITPTGLILKRGHDLTRVLEALAKKVRVVGR